MRFIGLRTYLISYKSPLARMIVSISFLVLMYYRDDLIHFQNDIITNALTFICFLLICPCIFIVYISLLELCYVFKNRHPKKLLEITKTISMEQLIGLLEKNDIIELELLCNNGMIKVGTSSNCNHNSTVFFDKQYYVDSVSFDSLDAFGVALASMVNSQECKVITIDGCDAKYYHV